MAGPYYVRSTDGSDASDGLSWANAKATLAGALAVAAAGERIWVSQAHAETQATAMTLTSPGTAAAPVEILCGNDASEPPTALATTATITTTGASTVTLNGFSSIHGITFNVGTGASAANFSFGTTVPCGLFMDACTIALLTTAAGSRIYFCSASPRVASAFLRGCALVFGAVGQRIQAVARLRVEGGSAAATGTVPTALIQSTAAFGGNISLQGVNLSTFGAGTALVALDTTSPSHSILFAQCKLGASVSLTTGTPPGFGGPTIVLDNCDSADTNYRMQRHQYEGDVYSETTIVRTGGASDGTTALAHKMVSSANSKFYAPLYGPEIVAYQLATGSAVTATVEIVHDNSTTQVDSAVWFEVEYLGTEDVPIATFLSDRAADILASATPQSSSSATWTTTGLATPNTQALAVTFTPLQIGVLRGRVALATPSYTVYVDPLMTVA